MRVGRGGCRFNWCNTFNTVKRLQRSPFTGSHQSVTSKRVPEFVNFHKHLFHQLLDVRAQKCYEMCESLQFNALSNAPFLHSTLEGWGRGDGGIGRVGWGHPTGCSNTHRGARAPWPHTHTPSPCSNTLGPDVSHSGNSSQGGVSLFNCQPFFANRLVPGHLWSALKYPSL